MMLPETVLFLPESSQIITDLLTALFSLRAAHVPGLIHL
jgi:hypothetical protein